MMLANFASFQFMIVKAWDIIAATMAIILQASFFINSKVAATRYNKQVASQKNPTGLMVAFFDCSGGPKSNAFGKPMK